MAQSDAGLISGKIRELTRLIRETRLAETLPDASNQEVSSESGKGRLAENLAENLAAKIRGQSRLDELAQSLLSVYAEIPKVAQARQDAFTFALLPGKPPRFWVDLTSFVVMTDGGQIFHFMKDTREGRITLFESDSLEETANAVTDYVAERIVQQRADGYIVDSPEAEESPLESQRLQSASSRIAKLEQPAPFADTPTALAEQIETGPSVSSAPIVIQPAPAQTDWVKLFLAFALGLFVGAVALFLAAWFQTPSAL